jgi:hypothetical protein
MRNTKRRAAGQSDYKFSPQILSTFERLPVSAGHTNYCHQNHSPPHCHFLIFYFRVKGLAPYGDFKEAKPL